VIRLGGALAVNNRQFVLHPLESLFDNLLLAVCTLRVALSARYERGLPVCVSRRQRSTPRKRSDGNALA
jgi:hypothetical protein